MRVDLAPLVAVVLLLLLLTACATSAAAEETPMPDPGSETIVLEGSIEVPGEPLAFVARLAPEAATLSIPAQGAFELALSEVERDGDALRFVLRVPGAPEAATARFALELDPDGLSARGTLRQHGLEFPVTARRADAATSTVASRPQTPQQPAPYTAEEVRFANPDAGIELAGTLTLPEGEGPWPAAVLLSGSGAQDRDETIFGHKPFLVIADHLTRHGIAVLRFDDRGVGGSGGDPATATTHDFAGDALAAVAFLAARPELDPARIGLVGHSEGALVAPLAAARAPHEVAFIVMLAGTGVPGRDVLVDQAGAGLRASGADEAALAPVLEHHRAVLDAAIAGDAGLEAKVEALVEAQLALAQTLGRAASGSDAAAIARQALVQLGSPWMRTFLVLDPAEPLGQIACPVLALWGSLDTQVTPALNRPAVEAALAAAPARDVTLLELDGLNHLFQSARTGAVAEYPELEETFSPAALDVMSDWLVARFGAP